MPVCIECGAELNPQDPPRYDVLNPNYDAASQAMSVVGPYCEADFANTVTGALVAGGKA